LVGKVFIECGVKWMAIDWAVVIFVAVENFNFWP